MSKTLNNKVIRESLSTRVNSYESIQSKTLQKPSKNISNRARTNLLILIQTENTQWRRSQTTKINSRYLFEVEEEYNEGCIIQLKEENYASSLKGGEVIFTKSQIGKNTVKSPDSPDGFMGRSDMRHLSGQSAVDVFTANSNNSEFFKRIEKRQTIAHHKIKYFKLNTLKKIRKESMDQELTHYSKSNFLTVEKTPPEKERKSLNASQIEENLEYINTNCGAIYNKKTKERAEKGFFYLKRLANKLIIQQKNKKTNFEEMKKILLLKENIDDDEISNSGSESNHANLSSHKSILKKSSFFSTSQNNNDIPQIVVTLPNRNSVNILGNTKTSTNCLSIKPKIPNEFQVPLKNYPNSSRKLNGCGQDQEVVKVNMNNSFSQLPQQENSGFFIKLYSCDFKKEPVRRKSSKIISLKRINNSSDEDAS